VFFRVHTKNQPFVPFSLFNSDKNLTSGQSKESEVTGTSAAQSDGKMKWIFKRKKKDAVNYTCVFHKEYI